VYKVCGSNGKEYPQENQEQSHSQHPILSPPYHYNLHPKETYGRKKGKGGQITFLDNDIISPLAFSLLYNYQLMSNGKTCRAHRALGI
jgi:hypothetical protein